jgi:hypothetical protein
MNRLEARDPKYFARSAYAGVFAASTSGVNATAIVDTGIPVNQLASPTWASGVLTEGVETGRKFEGILFSIPVSFVADSGASIAYSLTLKSSSASGGTYAAFATGTTTISNAGTGTGATVVGVAYLSASLVSAKKFIRGNCSRLGSVHDTGGAQLASNMIFTFFGPNYCPATAA